MKEIEELERASGRGSVYTKDDTLLGEADYAIAVLQTVHVERDGRIPGLKDIEGWIEPIGPIATPLTLHLQDGRRFDFFYSNSEGGIEDRAGRGLYEPN